MSQRVRLTDIERPRDGQLRRIRYVTEHYRDLHGLTAVPVGVGTVLLGIIAWYGALISPITLVVVGASIGLVLVAGRYYRRTYGEVEAHKFDRPLLPFRSRLPGCLQHPSCLVQLLICIAATPVIGLIYSSFGSSGAAWLWFGTWLILLNWREVPYTLFKLLGGVAALVLGMLSPFGVLPGMLYTLSGGLLVVGIFVIVAGLIDHVILVTTLHPVKEEADEPAV